MDDLQLLKAVREKLTPQGAWTQNVYARNSNGDVVSSRDFDAVSWCILGAADMGDRRGYEGQLADAMGFKSAGRMENWNDRSRRTQTQIIARLDAAIARTQRQS